MITTFGLQPLLPHIAIVPILACMGAFIHSEHPWPQLVLETVVTSFSVTAASFWGVLRFLVVALGLGLNIDYFPAATPDQLISFLNLWLEFAGIFCKISFLLCMVAFCGGWLGYVCELIFFSLRQTVKHSSFLLYVILRCIGAWVC